MVAPCEFNLFSEYMWFLQNLFYQCFEQYMLLSVSSLIVSQTAPCLIIHISRCNGLGGDSAFVWNYWAYVGFVSGGAWNSSSGCKPYPYFPCNHYEEGTYGPCQNPPVETPCNRACRTGYPVKYKNDRKKVVLWFRGK